MCIYVDTASQQNVDMINVNTLQIYMHTGFFCLTCVIGERAPVAVKHEPAFLPRFDFAPHLDQVAAARLLRDGQVEARVGAVARRLDVRPKVEVVLPHWQVARQRPRLWTESKKGGERVQ